MVDRWLATYCLFALCLACKPVPESPAESRADLAVAEAPDAPDLAPPAACDPVPSYPQGPYDFKIGAVLPNLRFQRESGELALGHFYRPFKCQRQAKLLVLRVQAAWCGPCQWHARSSRELLGSAIAERITLVDVLIRDELNRPAGPGALGRFAALYDRRPELVADPEHRLRAAGQSEQDGEVADALLPLLIIADVRLMRIEAVLGNPDPDTLDGELRRILARLDGQPEPSLPPPRRTDGRFTRDVWAQISAMAVSSTIPLDPTNRYEANLDAVELGRQLFQDRNLGPARDAASCAGCHQPGQASSDGRSTALGYDAVGGRVVGDRNTPWLGGVAWSRFQFWDGRADSLWAQALGPLESPKEFGSSRLHVVHTVLSRYRDAYARIFGPVPDLADRSRFPADGKPGTPAWDGMSPADQKLVNQIFANIGKALAAYERQIRPAAVALDRYIAGDSAALTEKEKDGLLRFFELGCAHCHHGPMLSDGSFHNIRFATGQKDGAADRGWIDGAAELLKSEFRGNGTYSDDPAAAVWLAGLRSTPEMLGQMKTPSLRGVADTAPLGHGGDLATIEKLVERYSERGLPMTDTRATGERDPALVKFDKLGSQAAELAEFLRTLKGTLIYPPM